MSKKVLGVLVSGRGSNLQSIFDAIQAGRLDAKIGLVLSDNPAAQALKRIAGSGIPTAVVQRPVYNSKQEFEQALIRELEAHHVDLVVLAGFMRILSPGFVNAFSGRIMNIHPSLLPSFPGLDPQEQALRHGVKVSGCTVHFVDEGTDSGPIILQEAVPVLDNDTAETLAARILHAEHVLYPRAISLYCSGKLLVEGRRVKIAAAEKEDEHEN